MNLTELAAACRGAAETLDREEHRYVERFAPCPNGCVFDYADGATVKGQHRSWPPNTPPVLIRVSGPDDCRLCDDGTIEDEDAPWVDPQIEALTEAANRLDQLADATAAARRITAFLTARAAMQGLDPVTIAGAASRASDGEMVDLTVADLAALAAALEETP